MCVVSKTQEYTDEQLLNFMIIASTIKIKITTDIVYEDKLG